MDNDMTAGGHIARAEDLRRQVDRLTAENSAEARRRRWDHSTGKVKDAQDAQVMKSRADLLAEAQLHATLAVALGQQELIELRRAELAQAE